MNTVEYNFALAKVMFSFFLTAFLVLISATYTDLGEWLWQLSRKLESWEFDEIMIAVAVGFTAALVTAICQLALSHQNHKLEKSTAVHGKTMRSQLEIETLLQELERDTISAVDNTPGDLQGSLKVYSKEKTYSRENILTIRALEWAIGKEVDDSTPISRYR